MKLKVNIAFVTLATLVFLVIPRVNAAEMPDVTVKNATEEILALLRKNNSLYKKQVTKLFEMVHEKILPYFDFRAMSKLVLGRNWRTAKPEQQQRFTVAFRDLLVRTYATALLKYTNEEIVYLPFHASAGDKKVIVKTKIVSKSGAPDIPLYYSFYFKNEEWKVFDVSIEGVSLVNNYRNVYQEKIRKQGIESVIEQITRDPGTTKKHKS